MRCVLFYITFTCCVYLTPVICDVFTSLVDLEKVIPVEKKLVDIIDKYIEAEKKRLDLVQKIKDDYKKHHELASSNPDEFLSNPINVFLLIKKLTSEWYSAIDLMLGGEGKAFIMGLPTVKENLNLPKEVDLHGVSEALLKLQEVYKLDTSALARGRITGTEPPQEFTANDCYEMGRQSYRIGDYQLASLWMQEALNKLGAENPKTASKHQILEHLASAAYMQGDLTRALALANELFELNPDHLPFKVIKDYYEHAVIHPEEADHPDYVRKYGWKHFSERSAEEYEDEQEAYGKLCRGEVPPASRKSLLCRYKTHGNPSFLLQPVKEEEINNQPKILVYRDVATTKEMNHLVALSRPKLGRSSISDIKYGDSWHLTERIAKSAMLLDSEDPVVGRFSRKVQDITGFTVKTAEPWEVINYGVGGHSDPHFDFEERELRRRTVGGNKIATWYMYMSDISAGGAVVFTEMNITVPVEKGSAVFWINLLPNGEPDRRTKHADCPVLTGIKWAAKKMFRLTGQDGRQRCLKNSNY